MSVTDYDEWHVSEQPVTVEMVIRTLSANTAYAQEALTTLVGVPANRAHCPCPSALADAILSDRASIPEAAKDRLRPLVGKYLP